MNKLMPLSTILLSIVLIGCGGGGGGDKNDPTLQYTNNVTLGPVAGANVTISTLDGTKFLYSTVTDESGNYKINIEEFKENLNALNSYPEYLLVSATGGEDIDPEDDGDNTNSQSIPVNGTVKGIFKTNILLTEEELSINLLSTAISETLKNQDEIDDELIAYTAKQLGAEDINGDGKIDNNDIIKYKMVEYDSDFEDNLRNGGFLDGIHEGDDSKIEEITDEFKELYNLMFIKYTVSNGIANLEIENSKSNSQIMYIKNAQKDDLFNNIYSSAITLEKNDYVIYKECENNKCSLIQIASFDGEKIHQYFLRVSNFGVYSDMTYMNNLRQSIINDSEKIQKVELNIKIISENISEVEDDIFNLNSQIENINDNLQSGL